jgi:hypothetical protein
LEVGATRWVARSSPAAAPACRLSPFVQMASGSTPLFGGVDSPPEATADCAEGMSFRRSGVPPDRRVSTDATPRLPDDSQHQLTHSVHGIPHSRFRRFSSALRIQSAAQPARVESEESAARGGVCSTVDGRNGPARIRFRCVRDSRLREHRENQSPDLRNLRQAVAGSYTPSTDRIPPEESGRPSGVALVLSFCVLRFSFCS